MAVASGIGGIGVDRPPPPAKVRPRPDAPGWTGIAEMEAEAGGAAPAVDAAPALGLEGLLALQETAGQPNPRAVERDRLAREHGRRMLAALGGLQRLVLGEADPAPALRHLLDLANEVPEEAGDPVLASALGAIRLRVRVELARRGF